MNKLTIGVIQAVNTTDIAHNADQMLRVVSQLAAFDLVVFPECALTGFSAKPEPCAFEDLSPYLAQLSKAALMLDMMIVVPSIMKTSTDQWLNTGWVCTPEGHGTQFVKTGLTESEKQFFSVDDSHNQRTLEWKGCRFGMLICREAADPIETYFQTDDVDVILWPGYWRWDTPFHWREDIDGALGDDVFANAKQWQKPLIQANFCANDASDPRASGPSGHSIVVNAKNELIHQGAFGKNIAMKITMQAINDRWQIASCEDIELI